jgi:hypothetical protein
MVFDLSTLPKLEIEEAKLNGIEIVRVFPHVLSLFNKGNQWMVVDQHTNQEVKELYSSYDLAYGDVLISGLGFGILATWIASKPEVNSVTVVEVSPEIIELYKKKNLHIKINIINTDIHMFTSDNHYDCFFLDHYEMERFEWRLKDIQELSSKINHDVLWAWSLEEIYANMSYNLSTYDLRGTHLFNTRVNFYTNWSYFTSTTLKIPTLPKLSEVKINEYVYTYFDRIGYTPMGWV